MSRIRLSVPATLRHKDLVVMTTRVAAQASAEPPPDEIAPASASELSDPFTAELVSAIAELVNNIALHGHADNSGTMDFTFTSGAGYIEIEIRERGTSFDIARVTAPDLEALPEGGMGLFIVRSFVDELWYEPGPTNVWSLVKYRSNAAGSARKQRLRQLSAVVDHELDDDSAISADSQSHTPPLGISSLR